MYKKISKIIIVCMSFSSIICMQEENTLEQDIQKNITPILAVNNFVMPVTSAYRALKREVELPYESYLYYSPLDTLERKNKGIRIIQSKNYQRVYELSCIKNKQDALPALPRSTFSCAGSIEIIFTEDEKSAHIINALIIFSRIIYRAKEGNYFGSKYFERRYKVRYNKDIIKFLPQRPSTCCLLYPGNKRIAHRIIFKNACNTILNSVAAKGKALVLWQAPRVRQPQLVNTIVLNAPQPSQELVAAEQAPYSTDIHILNDDIEDCDNCLPFCKRMMAVFGALLFLYLYS